MDCHVFRRACQELVVALLGARIEKIHQIAEHTLQIAIYTHHQKKYLQCRTGRSVSSFIMVSSHKMNSGIEPPAPVMRLRKHLSGRRLIDARVDWIGRALFFCAANNSEHGGMPTWFEINLREGVRLLPFGDTAMLPSEDEQPLLWPANILSTLIDSDKAQELQEIWRQWPAFSPSLRRTLVGMCSENPIDGPKDAEALLCDLQYGGGDLFGYKDEQGKKTLWAWPLPSSLRKHAHEHVFENALEALTFVGEQSILSKAGTEQQAHVDKSRKAELSRLERLLRKFDDEEARLQKMADAQQDALALQRELFLFAPEEKREAVQTTMTEPLREIALNPRLTVRENMAALFHKAARGRRGLAMLSPRREQVQAELANAQANMTMQALPKRVKTKPLQGKHNRQERKHTLPKNIQCFQSSDGFTLYRGRDAKGNALLLKLGAAHDLWLHTGLGTGAHVLIRRDHPAHEVPDLTLQEAAILAANKSIFQQALRAEVMVAEVRHVRPMKGAKVGMVRIDKQLPSIPVQPNMELESSLLRTM